MGSVIFRGARGPFDRIFSSVKQVISKIILYNLQSIAYTHHENVTKKIVLSFLEPKISNIFSIFSPTMCAYFCSILSVWVYACVCSIVCRRIFMFLDVFFSFCFARVISEFSRISSKICPPWPPISYVYGWSGKQEAKHCGSLEILCINEGGKTDGVWYVLCSVEQGIYTLS